MQETAALCRQCHSAVHLFADERALGEHYNTVEALLQQESLAKFAAFQNKQKARKGATSTRSSTPGSDGRGVRDTAS